MLFSAVVRAAKLFVIGQLERELLFLAMLQSFSCRGRMGRYSNVYLKSCFRKLQEFRFEEGERRNSEVLIGNKRNRNVA